MLTNGCQPEPLSNEGATHDVASFSLGLCRARRIEEFRSGMSRDGLDLAGFKLTFDDEFNGFSSNGPSNPFVTGYAGTWDTTYSYGERKLNDEVQWYSDSTTGTNPFSVQSGVLSITAAPSTDLAASQGQAYTSGAITTFHSFSQQYGYFEIRAELPEGIGMWPAFWMLPTQHVWPPELDPLEAFGSNGPSGEGGAYALHSGLVEIGSGGRGAWHGTAGANLYTQFNTFGVNWEADIITFYLNGTAYASMPTPADFDQPMYLLANLAVGGNWAGAPVGETAALKIDYIRAFSRDGGNPVIVQQPISSPDGRGFDFYGAVDADDRPALGGTDAAAPAATAADQVVAPTGTQIIGQGANTLALAMNEDAYLGDAQFLVTVDGVQRGGVLSTSASRAAGAVQTFLIQGDFEPGRHQVGINFINNYGSVPGADRNLFLTSATIDGSAIPGALLAEYSGGEQDFSFTVGDPAGVSTTILGSGPDSFVLNLSEQAWAGDAHFTVMVDGAQVGGTATVTAIHAAGQTQAFKVRGTFGTLSHVVQVNFTNDAYGGTADQDRNLYVDSMTRDGTATPLALTMLNQGAVAFALPASPVPSLFDAAYYLAQNPDVAAAGVSPYQHYLQFGWREGRNPSALFNTRFYLNQNPDVAGAGIDPLAHYAAWGWKEGRDPSILFSTRHYLTDNPGVAAAGTDPLLDYITFGEAAGRSISPATPHPVGPQDPLVDDAFVNAAHPGIAAQGLDASSWFHATGWREGANPDALFDSSFYLKQNPDVVAAGVDPLLHYEVSGWREGRDPSLLFSTAEYLNHNPDLRLEGTNPLQYELQHGVQKAGTDPLFIVVGDADSLVDAGFYDRQLGATLIPTGTSAAIQAARSYDTMGWQKGLNPNAMFDTSYYLAHNPDVAAAHINPLLHYKTYGWHEGRNPSARFSTDRYEAAYPDVQAASLNPLLHYLAYGLAEGRQAFSVA